MAGSTFLIENDPPSSNRLLLDSLLHYITQFNIFQQFTRRIWYITLFFVRTSQSFFGNPSYDNEFVALFSVFSDSFWDGEEQRKSTTDSLSMMDFLYSALSIGDFVNLLMITSLFRWAFAYLLFISLFFCELRKVWQLILPILPLFRLQGLKRIPPSRLTALRLMLRSRDLCRVQQ